MVSASVQEVDASMIRAKLSAVGCPISSSASYSATGNACLYESSSSSTSLSPQFDAPRLAPDCPRLVFLSPGLIVRNFLSSPDIGSFIDRKPLHWVCLVDRTLKYCSEGLRNSVFC
ncbi:hypothetical protein RRG08_064113 [Elysia crispata]|uniref:Uncharacterized protein n=1 Tax=Elysia crispata TaxID=231223 RepID=A0AAE1B7D6_9GAST|nr:hypothetical protein RRG08_064113 [Elysia crispata]